jgi:hypothetical protein
MNKLVWISMLLAASLFAVGRGAAEEMKNPCEPVSDIVRMIEGGDPLSWYHGTKKEGFTDTQIRDGFVWWIEQPHEEPGKKKGWVARRSANIGMNLFRNDPLLEKAVLDAQLNPGVYEKIPDMGNAVARYGSEGLIGEFTRAGIGIPSSDAAIDEERVPEESGFRRPGPTRSRSFPGDPAVASDGQSHSDGMAASLSFLPPVAGWLLVGLGVVMMAAALLCRRRMSGKWLAVIVVLAFVPLVLGCAILLQQITRDRNNQHFPL